MLPKQWEANMGKPLKIQRCFKHFLIITVLSLLCCVLHRWYTVWFKATYPMDQKEQTVGCFPPLSLYSPFIFSPGTSWVLGKPTRTHCTVALLQQLSSSQCGIQLHHFPSLFTHSYLWFQLLPAVFPWHGYLAAVGSGLRQPAHFIHCHEKKILSYELALTASKMLLWILPISNTVAPLWF